MKPASKSFATQKIDSKGAETTTVPQTTPKGPAIIPPASLALRAIGQPQRIVRINRVVANIRVAIHRLWIAHAGGAHPCRIRRHPQRQPGVVVPEERMV